MKTPETETPDQPLSDRKFREFERVANATVHELVFACQLAGCDELDDAANALIAAHCNVSRLQDVISHAQRRAAKLTHRHHPAPPFFVCPKCGHTHTRGPVNGVDSYRCLNCGYVGPRKEAA